MDASPFNTLFAGSTPGPSDPSRRRQPFPSLRDSWVHIDRSGRCYEKPGFSLAGLRAELEQEERRETQRWAQRKKEHESARRALKLLESYAPPVRCVSGCGCLHCRKERLKVALATSCYVFREWVAGNVAVLHRRYVAPLLHQVAEVRAIIRLDILPPAERWASWIVEQLVVAVILGIFVIPLSRIAYLKFTRTFYDGWFDNFMEALYRP